MMISGPGSDREPGPPVQQFFRHSPGLWPTAAAAVYLVVAVSVAAIEYVSEMSKISRGTSTDTFSPFLFTNLLTLPVSVVHSSWSGYPAQFSASAYRHAVRSAAVPVAVNIVATAALIVGIVLLCTCLRRRGARRSMVRAQP